VPWHLACRVHACLRATSGLLINRIARIVHNAPGGGLHRLELADMLGLPARGPSMREALGIAYRRHRIDFCRQYVVKPGGAP
jgi:hypothetical protein